MKYPPANAHSPIHCRALIVMARESSVTSSPCSQTRYRGMCLSFGYHGVNIELKPRLLPSSLAIDVDVIAEMVNRSTRTMRDWLSGWRIIRLHSVVTGHTGNENAAKLTCLITP